MDTTRMLDYVVTPCTLVFCLELFVYVLRVYASGYIAVNNNNIIVS